LLYYYESYLQLVNSVLLAILVLSTKIYLESDEGKQNAVFTNYVLRCEYIRVSKWRCLHSGVTRCMCKHLTVRTLRSTDTERK